MSPSPSFNQHLSSSQDKDVAPVEIESIVDLTALRQEVLETHFFIYLMALISFSVRRITIKTRQRSKTKIRG